MLRDVRRGNTNTKRTKKDYEHMENDPTLNEGATGGVGMLHDDAESNVDRLNWRAFARPV